MSRRDVKEDQATWPCSGWTDGWTENLRVEQGHQLKGAFRADIGVKGCGTGAGGGPAGLNDGCREGEVGAPRQPRP